MQARYQGRLATREIVRGVIDRAEMRLDPQGPQTLAHALRSWSPWARFPTSAHHGRAAKGRLMHFACKSYRHLRWGVLRMRTWAQ